MPIVFAAQSPDEKVTRDVLLGQQSGEESPEILIAVADATNLERSLCFVLELKNLKRPIVLALNMMDLAKGRGMKLDLDALSRELGLKVIPTVAVQGEGIETLVAETEKLLKESSEVSRLPAQDAQSMSQSSPEQVRKRFQEVDALLKRCSYVSAEKSKISQRIDQVVLHPLWGSILLFSFLALMFQAVFTWAEPLMGGIETSVGWIGEQAKILIPEGPLQSLMIDGIIMGVGSVLVFLPQILILFFFILVLEDIGYMARAAFLMDRLMEKVGLHGRAFIPLLSSFACAIPGMMAARTIENPKDRLSTVLIAPLMTCSARLPVYSLLIAAFIPNNPVIGPFKLQGLVMLGLYIAGILFAIGVAFVLKRTLLSGPNPPFLMELPTYKRPSFRNLFRGLFDRSRLFVRRAGTLILAISIVLWFLASYPKSSMDQAVTEGRPAITGSYAGKIGHAIEPALAPLGYDWRVSVALIPGFAAREVMVGALATVYSLEDESALESQIARDWTLATALSLLVWYIFAPQCLSTLAVARRETNSLKWPLFMFAYMLGLAYLGAFAVFQIASKMGI